MFLEIANELVSVFRVFFLKIRVLNLKIVIVKVGLKRVFVLDKCTYGIEYKAAFTKLSIA